MKIESKVRDHINATDFSYTLNTLAPLGKFIDIFFEKVLVNDKNPDIRTNRLALLKQIHSITETVADFSKLVV